MHYRREIDGLRALAVMPVIFFHAGFDSFQGGFVGVDVFFVISGYLITSIILKEKTSGTFSLLRFYERRARRILPALFLVALCCIPFAIRWMTPAQLGDFSQSLMAVALFISNILFWRESGYFDEAAEEKPLLHTWSLAVEEQYYLFFPLFIMAFWFLGKAGIARLTAGIALASLLVAEWGWRHEPAANFYLLPTRAWELFAGALCASRLAGREPIPREWPSLAGLGAILLAVAFYSEDTPFPSVYALLPVLGSCAVILYAAPGTRAAAWLSTRTMVGIGLISYSAYLWHQPLFAFARLMNAEAPAATLMLALAALSLLLAWLSWRFVEVPFRRARLPQRTPASSTMLVPRAAVFAGAFAVAAILFGAGWIGAHTPVYMQASLRLLDAGQRGNYAMVQQAIEEHARLDIAGECRFLIDSLDARRETDRLEACRMRHGPALMVLGDSHAEDIFHALALADAEPFLLGLSKGGCQAYTPNPDCPYDETLRFVAERPGLVRRILYKQSGSFLVSDGEGGAGNLDLYLDRDPGPMGIHGPNVEAALDYLRELSAYVDVAWLGPRLEPQIDPWSILRQGCEGAGQSLKPDLVATVGALDAHLAARAAREPWLDYLSEIAVLDFDAREDLWNCRQVFWRDGDHWSAAGERRFGARLVRALDARESAH